MVNLTGCLQLLCASGFLFMGATEEQMQILNDLHISHLSYILLLYSVAFILFLCKSLRSPSSRTLSHAANHQLSISFSTYMASMPGLSRRSPANQGISLPLRFHQFILVRGQIIHGPFRP